MVINSYRRDLLDKEIELHQDNLFGRLLDIGGGTKRGAVTLFGCVTDRIVIDRDKRTRPTVIGNAESLPFKPETFDSIKCTEVLEYLNAPEKAVSEMGRVLKNHGGIMVSTPFNMGIHYDNDLVRFTGHKLERMFKEAGLRTVYITRQGLYFTVIGYMLKQAILNTKSKTRWLLYWAFPVLDLLVILDRCSFVKDSQFLSSFTTGYFMSIIKPIITIRSQINETKSSIDIPTNGYN